VHVLAPAREGGLERVVRTLAGGLTRRGHQIAVAAVISPGEAPHAWIEAARDAGIDVVPVEVPPRGYLAERRAIRALVAERRAGILHTHGYRPDVVDGSIARGRGIPAVSTVHGFIGAGFKGRLYERLQLSRLRRMNAVIAVSAPLARLLGRFGVSPDRIYTMPNAWSGDLPLPRDAARQRLGLPLDAWIIGWVGRLSREKGPDVMMRAFRRLPLDARLSMVGEGPLRSSLEAEASRAGLSERVRWHGPVPDAGLLMSAFDAVALSSRTEGTPMTVLEAMAAGVPVVATSVGGVPDLLGGGAGMLVPSEDATALTLGLERLRTDPRLVAEQVAMARRRLEQDFGPEAWLDRHEELYGNLLRLSPVGRPPQ
jgi:glycosyltransferase involved in cell wall biosynthesis